MRTISLGSQTGFTRTVKSRNQCAKEGGCMAMLSFMWLLLYIVTVFLAFDIDTEESYHKWL